MPEPLFRRRKYIPLRDRKMDARSVFNLFWCEMKKFRWHKKKTYRVTSLKHLRPLFLVRPRFCSIDLSPSSVLFTKNKQKCNNEKRKIFWELWRRYVSLFYVDVVQGSAHVVKSMNIGWQGDHKFENRAFYLLASVWREHHSLSVVRLL